MPRRRLNPGEVLWPIHLRPLADELLSSWIVRLGYAHNLKLRTFARLLWPTQPEVWYRDVDRYAPAQLLTELSAHTGIQVAKLEATTLRAYQGRIYQHARESGILQWILPLLLSEWQHKGFGLQFCPKCLSEDSVPYFRKRWRVAFYTWCGQHNVMVHDRCPNCGAPICVFHPNSATHNDRNPPPVTTPSRPPIPPAKPPPIPIKNPPGRRVLNSVTKTGVHVPSDALLPRNRRIDSPLSSIRCAPLTSRSRIASAIVGLPPLR